jgi:hypothetical protein
MADVADASSGPAVQPIQVNATPEPLAVDTTPEPIQANVSYEPLVTNIMPQAVQGMASARLNGYNWPEIDGHINQVRTIANQFGYSQDEVDAHLGYKPGLSNRLADGIMQNLANAEPTDTTLKTASGGFINPTSNPEKPYDVGPIPPDVRHDYATAVIQGDAKGPHDFATAYTDALGYGMGSNVGMADQGIASQLPNQKDAIDYALGVTQDANLPGSHLLDTTANVLDAWAHTGTPMGGIYQFAHNDPLLSDVLTQPYQPSDRPFPPAESDPEAVLAAQQSKMMEPFVTGLTKALGESGAQIVSGLAGQMQPDAYMHSYDRFLNGQMDPHEAAGFLTMHIVGAPEGTLAKTGPKSGIGFPQFEGEASTANPGFLDTLKAVIKDQTGTLGNARTVKPVVPDTGLPGKITPDVLDDELNRLRTNDTADKIVALKLAGSLPPEWKDQAFQEKVSQEVENRMRVDGGGFNEAGEKGTTSPETQKFLAALKPLTDVQTSTARAIKVKLGDLETGDPKIDQAIRSVDDGYMHRVVETDQSRSILDPNAENQDVIGGTPRSLSKFASGLQQRSENLYVLENQETGARIFGSKKLNDAGLKMGQDVPSPDGAKWVVKPATMEEVEANVPDIKYQKNFLANTLDNTLRLQRVNRNIDFLQNMAKELERNGQFISESNYKSNQGFGVGPPGKVQLTIPGLRGWADPDIARVLNDYFKDDRTDLDNWLRKANRFLLHSMFITPVPHAANVAAHWTVGRGWDWIKPSGYGTLMSTSMDAMREVWNTGPRYLENLREGSGLQYGSTATQNFYRVLMDKVFNEQMANQRDWGPLMKALGYTGVPQAVEHMYGLSSRALWMANDMFLLQRQFELQRQGVPLREAIFQSEKDIPNYRIPSEVMGSPALAQALKNPNRFNFGRYRYGQIRSLYNIVHDMVSPSATGAARMDAIGKALILGALGYVIANQAYVRGPGPFSFVSAGKKLAQEGIANWPAAASSLATLAPVLNIVTSVLRNSDLFGKPLIQPGSTGRGQMMQGLEAAVGQFYPGQLMLQALKQGGIQKAAGSLVGLTLGPTYTPSKHVTEEAQRSAALRERYDAMTQWFEQNTGGAPPEMPMYGRGGSVSAGRGRTSSGRR